MREIILAILAFFGIVTAPAPEISPPQTPSIKPNTQITIDDKTYAVYWQEISENLELIPNFEHKQASTEIMSRGAGSGSAREECSYGTSGGFYTTDNKPIGLFVADGRLLSRAVSNTTLNGFFVKTDHFALTRQPPANSVEFAIQSGPYITPKSVLKIKNDIFARRVLVARSGSEWRFWAISEKDNTFSGPLLTDLPQIAQELGIDEALNLDGGSASAFYSENGVRLGELTPVGSLFCGK